MLKFGSKLEPVIGALNSQKSLKAGETLPALLLAPGPLLRPISVHPLPPFPWGTRKPNLWSMCAGGREGEVEGGGGTKSDPLHRQEVTHLSDPPK